MFMFIQAHLEIRIMYTYTLRCTKREGYPNGKEAVLKTAGRKPLQVRVLSPPLHSIIIIGNRLFLGPNFSIHNRA